MENINFRGIPTSLFLNGPKLGIVTDPQSVSNVVGFVTFTGIATATFPDTNFDFDSVSGGSIAFKWYFDGSRILDTSEDSNSNAEIVGFSSATGTGSTITISGLEVGDSGKEIYFEADYVPSAYQTTPPVTAGTARSTGNAFNEPLRSGIGTIDISPIIDITTQPEGQLVSVEDTATYTIAAQKTPGGGVVDYQWQLNGNDLSDGTTTRTVIGGSSAKITVTDANGRLVDTIDFSKVSSYSGPNKRAINPELTEESYTLNSTYTLVADADVTTKLLVFGAGGGGSDVRSVRGSRGGVSEGTFTFIKDQEYKLIVGSAGDRVTAGRPGGGRGGGTRGSSGRGGGGGYSGLFLGSITHANAIIIAGGGGGSTGDPGRGGAGGGTEGAAGSNGGRAGGGGSQTAGGVGRGGNESGSELQGGNANSAAAGGGGYYGGGAGQPSGTISDGAGGGGSGYIHPTLITDGRTIRREQDQSNFPGGTSANGSFRIEFTSTTKEVSTTVTGSNTDTLTITAEAAANGTIRCKCTATGVQESPVFSNTVSYVVSAPRSLIEIETYNYNDATAELSEFDLANGDLTINYASYTGNAVCLYSGDQDIDVEMELYGGSGGDPQNTAYAGGEGGYSKIRFTMERDVEHVLTGLFPAVDAPFLYRKASVIAIVGGGGDAGTRGNGGRGGGIGVSGSKGGGVDGGEAPIAIGAGQGGQRARFGGAFDGEALTGGLVPPDHQAELNNNGDSAPCPRGVYWRLQGKAPCDELGDIKFRTPDGTEISNTAVIARGYKSGYNAIQTAGAGVGGGGDGGNGYSGGFGGTNGGGGGGAYGYTDGSVTVVESTQGGHIGRAKVIIRIADPSVANPGSTLQEVTFTVGRSAAYSNTIAFVKQSGEGPDRITFGPNSGTVVVRAGFGAVYTRESVLINGAPGGKVRLTDNTLELEDAGDNDYNDLTVTPDKGRFTSDSRYEFSRASELVTFTQSLTGDHLGFTMTLVSGTGTGPQTIKFGGSGLTLPYNNPVTATIQQGAVYTITSTNNVTTRSLSDGTLTLTDVDSNPGTLEITPDKGEWTSTSRYEFT